MIFQKNRIVGPQEYTWSDFNAQEYFLGERIGLARWKTADILKGPYLILLRWTLKAKINDHR